MDVRRGLRGDDIQHEDTHCAGPRGAENDLIRKRETREEDSENKNEEKIKGEYYVHRETE